MIDKNGLKKLSPEERIKKLKLMEEDRKKEVDEIEQLIKASMQEIRTDKIAKEVAPEQRAVDISRLFETAGEQRLERTAREEAPPSAFIRGTKAYRAIEQLRYDYTKLKGFDYTLSMGGNLTEEQKSAIGQIGERINVVERYMTEGEKAASMLDASRVVLYKLKKETGLG